LKNFLFANRFIRYFDYYLIMEAQEVVKSLAALAQASRLQIFRALVVAGPEGMNPSGLGEALSTTPATLSFHLKELMNAGLVSQERAGRNLIYRANFEQMNGLLAYLTQNCCAGQSCATTDAAGCGC
jgi:ArsR family transcriptional regulator, arsenate/arsenite/antimonite-responsive transcriptional repressor